jgi:hypothetical protein
MSDSLLSSQILGNSDAGGMRQQPISIVIS